jgi:WD40 repeat protein
MLSQLLASGVIANGGAISLSPNNKTIAVGDKNGNARIWSMDGKLLLTFRGHTDAVTSIA